MKHTTINLPFSVGISPTLHIRGLIAGRIIKKNETIERCPIILIDKKEEPHLKQTTLWRYYYEWNNTRHCIVLGYASLINHSYKPNAIYSFDYKNKNLIFKAIKNIKSGEEILVNYNQDPDSKAPLETILTDFNSHRPT